MYGMYDDVHAWDAGQGDRVAETEECVEELRAVLAMHGIKLPSLGIEPAAYAHRPSLPLVALGNCHVDVARAIAAVLRTAWRGEPQW